MTVVLGWGLATACSESGEIPETGEGVRLEIDLPACYGEDVSGTGDARSGETIAGTSRAGDDFVQRTLGNLPMTYLPAGSTLWLIISKKGDDGTFTATDPKGYVVKSVGGGYQSLYPCEHKQEEENGETVYTLLPETGSTALYLEEGTYKFRMLSPAKPLRGTNHKVQVQNGEYLYATDDRYVETSSSEIEVKKNAGGVQHIALKPMIQQVARMRFQLVAGKNIHLFMMMPAGIEISGIQNEDDAQPYNWGSDNIADTLQMKLGSKLARVYIKEFTETEENGATVLEGVTGVLPTDARSSSIIVLFNVEVNGVPTQYTTMLNEQMLVAGHSYTYRFRVDLEDGLVALTWLHQTWSDEVDF